MEKPDLNELDTELQKAYTHSVEHFHTSSDQRRRQPVSVKRHSHLPNWTKLTMVRCQDQFSEYDVNAAASAWYKLSVAVTCCTQHSRCILAISGRKGCECFITICKTPNNGNSSPVWLMKVMSTVKLWKLLLHAVLHRVSSWFLVFHFNRNFSRNYQYIVLGYTVDWKCRIGQWRSGFAIKYK